MTPPGRASLLAVVLFAALNAHAEEDAPTPPPPPPIEVVEAAAQPEAPQALHRVVFNDGQVLRGRLVSQTVTEVVLELSGGGVLEIPTALVRAVEVEHAMKVRKDGEFSFASTNRTRYFYSPSAHMLKKGEAYFSQKELVFSSFAYGISDNFSLIAGTVAPAWFLGTEGFNGIFGLKAGAPVSEDFSIAAGLESLVLPGLGSSTDGLGLGLLFGSATYGDTERHLTLSVGKPLVLEFGSGRVESMDLITTLSGHLPIHRHVGLMTENWFVVNSFAQRELATAHAFGARFFAGQLAADLGFIWFTFTDSNSFEIPTAVPLPWLDFTWNFDLTGA